MFKSKTLAVGLSIFAVLGCATSARADPIEKNAHDIRKLSIMLMVTSLRCRSGEHDFQAEYRRFTVAHQANLSRAHTYLQRQMSASYSPKKRALDRLGVSVANSYGNGHPWLDCAELKQATTELTMSQESQRLADLAGILLAKAEPQRPSEEPTTLAEQDTTLPKEAAKPVGIAWWLRG